MEREKTLEELEKTVWDEPEYRSFLVSTCHALRKKPIKDFTTEDLRIMIGQEIGLSYLIPLALETLTENLFAEGDFFEGDLLKNVLDVTPQFWKNNRNYWYQLNELIKNRRPEIVQRRFDTTKFDNSLHTTTN